MELTAVTAIDSIASLDTKIASSSFSPEKPSAINLTRGLAKTIESIVTRVKATKIMLEILAVNLSANFCPLSPLWSRT